MQIQQLINFLKVADIGSINKAAEELFLSQPYLSRSIKNLEHELGISLFTRNNKGITLTEDGKKLYEYASVIMKQLLIIERMSSSTISPSITVASYPILLNVYALADFYENHRQTKIELLENRIEQVIENVHCGVADIGVIHFNNHQRKEIRSLLHHKNIEMYEMTKDTWYANVSEHNPLSQLEEVTMKQLKEYPIACLAGDYFYDLSLHIVIDKVSLRELRVLNFNSHGAVIDFIQNTDAFRFGPGCSYHDLKEKGIKTIPIKNMDLVISCAWIKRKNESISSETQEFIEILKKYYQRRHPYSPTSF